MGGPAWHSPRRRREGSRGQLGNPLPRLNTHRPRRNCEALGAVDDPARRRLDVRCPAARPAQRPAALLPATGQPHRARDHRPVHPHAAVGEPDRHEPRPDRRPPRHEDREQRICLPHGGQVGADQRDRRQLAQRQPRVPAQRTPCTRVSRRYAVAMRNSCGLVWARVVLVVRRAGAVRCSLSIVVSARLLRERSEVRASGRGRRRARAAVVLVGALAAL